MKQSKHLAIGLAIAFGLVGCGKDSKKDANPAPEKITLAPVTASTPSDVTSSGLAQQFKIMSDSERGELETRTKEVRDQIFQAREELRKIENQMASGQAQNQAQLQVQSQEIQSRIDSLVQQYSESYKVLAEDDHFRDLAKFSQEQGVSSLESIPERLNQAKAELVAQLERLKALEEPLSQKIQAAESELESVMNSFDEVESQLNARVEELRQKQGLSTEEQEFITSADRYVELSRELNSLKSEMENEHEAYLKHRVEYYKTSKIVEDVETNKIRLKVELDRLTEDQADRRQELESRINDLLIDIVTLDINRMEHAAMMQDSQEELNASENRAKEIQASLDEVTPRLQSFSNIQIDEQLNRLEQAAEALASLERDRRDWMDNVGKTEVGIETIETLQVFFVEKFPEASGQVGQQGTEQQPVGQQPAEQGQDTTTEKGQEEAGKGLEKPLPQDQGQTQVPQQTLDQSKTPEQTQEQMPEQTVDQSKNPIAQTPEQQLDVTPEQPAQEVPGQEQSAQPEKPAQEQAQQPTQQVQQPAQEQAQQQVQQPAQEQAQQPAQQVQQPAQEQAQQPAQQVQQPAQEQVQQPAQEQVQQPAQEQVQQPAQEQVQQPAQEQAQQPVQEQAQQPAQEQAQQPQKPAEQTQQPQKPTEQTLQPVQQAQQPAQEQAQQQPAGQTQSQQPLPQQDAKESGTTDMVAS